MPVKLRKVMLRFYKMSDEDRLTVSAWLQEYEIKHKDRVIRYENSVLGHKTLNQAKIQITDRILSNLQSYISGAISIL